MVGVVVINSREEKSKQSGPLIPTRKGTTKNSEYRDDQRVELAKTPNRVQVS